jgi:hypothetical protein
MQMRIRVKDWNKFQHYKDRNPLWIKLHKKVLDDFDFQRLPLASRALAPMLWLLASEYEGGVIEASLDEIAFRMRTTVEDLNTGLKPLLSSKFFDTYEDASNLIADVKHDAIPEKRREETETETKGSGLVVKLQTPPAVLPFQLPVWVPEKAWLAYLEMRKAKKVATTDRAKELVVKELKRLMDSGSNPEEVLYQSIRNSWTDVYPLKEQYVAGKNNQAGRQSAGQARTERTRSILTEALRERHGDSAMAGSDMPADADGNHVGGVGALLVRGAKGVSGVGD